MSKSSLGLTIRNYAVAAFSSRIARIAQKPLLRYDSHSEQLKHFDNQLLRLTFKFFNLQVITFQLLE